ncbi:TraR/DksA C4-type zinc finger protein [Thalassotalea psychrophila]|uniref:TraR/DksA C4-type zinc finger protein n=1 Tax=Thalassotalea psychrophila TaxID=3065647 RepID=A0ABY9TVC3_9GAMM|nr:TraR/DksA C4-type zinc finger protein [Colwelliaceae bacterium SQ149]
MIVEKLKVSLIAKQNELSKRLADIENDEGVDEIHQQTLQELQRIKQTLAMLQTEQYGICIECGKLISNERLEALPYSKHCFVCSENLEIKY